MKPVMLMPGFRANAKGSAQALYFGHQIYNENPVNEGGISYYYDGYVDVVVSLFRFLFGIHAQSLFVRVVWSDYPNIEQTSVLEGGYLVTLKPSESLSQVDMKCVIGNPLGPHVSVSIKIYDALTKTRNSVEFALANLAETKEQLH